MSEEDTLNIFIEESLQLLEECEALFLKLEEDKNDQDLVKVCFRNIHTIKGSSGFFDLKSIGSLAHIMEDALVQVRDHRAKLESEMIDLQLQGVDRLKGLLNDVENSNQIDVQDLLEQFRNFKNKEDRLEISFQKPSLEGVGEVHQYQVHLLNEVNEEAAKSLLGSMGEMTFEKTLDGKEVIQLKSLLSQNMLESARLGVKFEEVKTLPLSAETKEPMAIVEQQEKPVQKKSSQLKEKDSSVRVSFNLLNNLIELAGEVILSRNQFISKIEGSLLDDFKNMSQQITDLQQGLMKTRMQPLSLITNSFPRIVRDLSRKLKKEVYLQVKGDTLELDKGILEGLGGPFTHIIRNCLDHGIESPEERIQQGKSR